MGERDIQDKLKPLRYRIDGLDRQLVDLLNERAEVVVQVGKIKNDGASPVYAPDREQQVLGQVRNHNDGPLPDSCLEGIWRELMSGSFALERTLRIGFLGPDGSYSHLAARRQFGASVDYQALTNIRDVFDALARKDIDLGLVPIENSSQGGIGQTLDCFMKTRAKVCAEVLIGIHHTLLARCGLDEVKRVYSKPEALNQCQRWLSAHLPKVDQIGTASTSKAAEQAAAESGTAAVGSELAGDLYGLDVVQANIEDNPNNVTRFFVIAHEDAKSTGQDKTAILFNTAHEAGMLANVLDVFREHGLNLTHIDKRPSQQVNWEYHFFVDFEGHREQEQVIKGIEAASGHCLQLRVLGSFPKAQQVL